MTATSPSELTQKRRRDNLGNLRRFISSQPLGAVSFVVIVLATGVGFLAPYIAPHDPVAMDFGNMLLPPSWEQPFGTDNFGRDVFSRILYGARTAMIIGLSSALLGSTIGAIIGVVSAYFGGRIDMLIQRVVDIFLSLPIIILALVVVTMLGRRMAGGVDLNLIVAIAIPIIPNVARVVRSSALSIREMAYVDAARVAGYSTSRIIFRHMVPNLMATYLIMLTSYIAQSILLEASLSFLWLGVN